MSATLFKLRTLKGRTSSSSSFSSGTVELKGSGALFSPVGWLACRPDSRFFAGSPDGCGEFVAEHRFHFCTLKRKMSLVSPKQAQ